MRVRFKSLFWAHVTVFQMMTLEGWVDHMVYTLPTAGFMSVFYGVVVTVIGNYILFYMFVAIIMMNFASNDEETFMIEDVSELAFHLIQVRERIPCSRKDRVLEERVRFRGCPFLDVSALALHVTQEGIEKDRSYKQLQKEIQVHAKDRIEEIKRTQLKEKEERLQQARCRRDRADAKKQKNAV